MYLCVLRTLAVLLLIQSGAVALPVTQTFDSSGQPILGGDDPAFFPDVTIRFDYDDECMTSSCTLTVTLTYNDSDGLSSIGETLSGVAFDTFSGATQFDLSVALSTSTVSASSLVGAGSDDALADFGGGVNSDLDVTRHWGFRSGFVSSGTLAGTLLSSVGDAFPDTDALGAADLLTSGTLSGVESNPPDGTPFSIVDPNTCTGPPGSPSCGGLGGGFQDSQNRAWIQNEAVATLVYDGTTNKLTNIGNVDPIFGTEGRPLPEPGAGLMMFGLIAVGLRIRRMP